MDSGALSSAQDWIDARPRPILSRRPKRSLIELEDAMTASSVSKASNLSDPALEQGAALAANLMNYEVTSYFYP